MAPRVILEKIAVRANANSESCRELGWNEVRETALSHEVVFGVWQDTPGEINAMIIKGSDKIGRLVDLLNDTRQWDALVVSSREDGLAMRRRA